MAVMASGHLQCGLDDSQWGCRHVRLQPVMMPDNSMPYSLQAAHTFGLRAHARLLLPVVSEAALCEAVQACQAAREPFFVLGEGSNTVFTGDVSTTVLQMQIKGRQWLEPASDGSHRVWVAAGENWHELVEWTLFEGRAGLENLALIPGSVGACPVQNIGAYGVEVMDRIESVRILDTDTLQFRTLSAADCHFSYRDSAFKREWAGRAIITGVVFRLPGVAQLVTSYADVSAWLEQHSIASPTARDVFHAVVAVRTRKLPDPRVIGNAGSFFKNPVVDAHQWAELQHRWPDIVRYPQPDGRFKLAAGWMIDRAGLKGFRMGDAAVSERQALVLVNVGAASAADLKALIAHVQARVLACFGVCLEPEPVMVGD